MIPPGGRIRVVSRRTSNFPLDAAVFMVDGDPDEALVARCLGGEPDAFESIVSRYQRVLFNAAYRLLGDREEARDARREPWSRPTRSSGTSIRVPLLQLRSTGSW